MKLGYCAAIGDFDGVHLGHQKLIRTAAGNSQGYIPMVYTFASNCKGHPMITDIGSKRKLIQQLGIEKIVFEDFEKVKGLSPELFVKNVLIDKYGVKFVLCGENFRFGKGASGTASDLVRIAAHYGIGADVVKSETFTDVEISSTLIRSYIESGDMEYAAKLSGHRYFVTGKVVQGHRLGRQFGVPTANLYFADNSVIPQFGVYITETVISGKRYKGITNIGVRPSVSNDTRPNIETHIFDFCDDIYGKEITVEFIKLIRKEKKFDTEQQLFDRIEQDIKVSKSYFCGEEND